MEELEEKHDKEEMKRAKEIEESIEKQQEADE
jgi:hypothetical protein